MALAYGPQYCGNTLYHHERPQSFHCYSISTGNKDDMTKKSSGIFGWTNGRKQVIRKFLDTLVIWFFGIPNPGPSVRLC